MKSPLQSEIGRVVIGASFHHIASRGDGEVGDGKIFILPVERAVRIRTGEIDIAAVTPERE